MSLVDIQSMKIGKAKTFFLTANKNEKHLINWQEHEVTLTGFMKNDPHFQRHLSLDNEGPRDIVVHDEFITECSRIATCFNNFFQSVFTDSSASGF